MKQPNSRHCFVCGLENPIGLKLRFYQTGPGEVTTEYTVPEHFQGYPGVVHGGIVAAMLDEVVGRALIQENQGSTRFMYTARLTVRYRKNVPVSQPLLIVGRAGRDKSHAATATGAIYDEAGEVLAEVESLLVDVPEGTLAQEDLQALGWKVYPDDAHSFPSS